MKNFLYNLTLLSLKIRYLCFLKNLSSFIKFTYKLFIINLLIKKNISLILSLIQTIETLCKNSTFFKSNSNLIKIFKLLFFKQFFWCASMSYDKCYFIFCSIKNAIHFGNDSHGFGRSKEKPINKQIIVGFWKHGFIKHRII